MHASIYLFDDSKCLTFSLNEVKHLISKSPTYLLQYLLSSPHLNSLHHPQFSLSNQNLEDLHLTFNSLLSAIASHSEIKYIPIQPFFLIGYVRLHCSV